MPMLKLKVGEEIQGYKIIEIIQDKHIRYLCTKRCERGKEYKEMFFEDDLIKLKGE